VISPLSLSCAATAVELLPTRHRPHRQARLARLEQHLDRNRVRVTVARRLLITVWHVLTEGSADGYVDSGRVGSAMFRFPTG
jgi:hypothetical protein